MGQEVTIVLRLVPIERGNILLRPIARNKNSLPMRRAGSPGAFFLASQDGELNAGLGQQLRQATARSFDCARPAPPQPTHNSTSASRASAIVEIGRPCAQSTRESAVPRKGWARVSTEVERLAASSRETRRLPSPGSDACRRSLASVRSTRGRPRRTRRRSCIPTWPRSKAPHRADVGLREVGIVGV